MPLALPLAVRMKTGSGDKHVTRDLRDLTFRSTAPGGFASATLSFDRPLTTQPTEIDYYGSVYVYDRRNGLVVWEGLLEDPGRSAGDGQTWQVTAVGPSARAQDRTVPLIYIDQSLGDGFVRRSNVQGQARVGVSVTADPGGASAHDQAIVIVFQEGAGQVLGDAANWVYTRIADAGQKLARIDYTWLAGVTSANFSEKAKTRAASGGAVTTIRTDTWAVAGAGSTPKVVVTDFANGHDTLDLLSSYGGATGGVYAANLWSSMRNLFILAMRFDKTGTEITAYPNNYVLASDVVADLLGRLLVKFDGANASITATTFQIDSLAYPQGVSPSTLLDDLMLIEPGFYWAAWESGPSGLYRFEWSPWPTTVRYEANVYDGFDSPGSAIDLYNTVRVRYIDVAGNLATVQRTQTVTALTNAGLTREGLLDLTQSNGRTSLAYAQRAGDEWLVQRATPPNAGTLTVARPILDLSTGAMVQPWEIRPGTLIRVRGVLPRVDALNPSARDGVTVFRVAAVDFLASSATARLELDSYPRTVARALALLGKRR